MSSSESSNIASLAQIAGFQKTGIAVAVSEYISSLVGRTPPSAIVASLQLTKGATDGIINTTTATPPPAQNNPTIPTKYGEAGNNQSYEQAA